MRMRAQEAAQASWSQAGKTPRAFSCTYMRACAHVAAPEKRQAARVHARACLHPQLYSFIPQASCISALPWPPPLYTPSQLHSNPSLATMRRRLRWPMRRRPRVAAVAAAVQRRTSQRQPTVSDGFEGGARRCQHIWVGVCVWVGGWVWGRGAPKVAQGKGFCGRGGTKSDP